MLVGEGAAEECRVDEVLCIGGQDGEVEVASVGARLEGAVGGGQAEGGAAGDLARSAGGIGFSTPSADVDLFAIAHEESGRAQVDGARARADDRLPFDVAHVGQEAGDVLSAAGVGVNVPDDGHAGLGLSVSIGAPAAVALHEVDLVVILEPVVGAELGGQVAGGGVELDNPAFREPGPFGLDGAWRQGQVVGPGAAADQHLEVVESPETVVGRDLDAVGRIVPEAAEGASTEQGREVGAEAGHEGVLAAGVGGAARQRNVRRGRGGGDPDAALRSDVHLAAVEVAEVGPEDQAFVESVGAGSSEEGGRVERVVGAVGGQEITIEPGGLDVVAVDGDGHGAADVEVRLEAARRGGEVVGPGGAQQGDLSPGLVVGQAVRDVGPAASDVGAVQEPRAVRIEDGDRGVADAVGKDVHVGLDGVRGGGIAGGEGDRAADEGAAWAVARGRAEVVSRAARKRGEGDLRVDDEGPAFVVLPHGEAHRFAFDAVGTGHLIEGAVFVPLEGKWGGQFGRESGGGIVQGVVQQELAVGADGRLDAPVLPSDVVGVGARFDGELEGGPPLPGPAPPQPDARPEVISPEHGGGLHMLRPVGRVVGEVEVLPVGGQAAPHPVQVGQRVGVDPGGAPVDAASGPNVVVLGSLGFRRPLPTGPPSPVELDAPSGNVGAVHHMIRPLALIGHIADLRRRNAGGQEEEGRQEAHHQTNKFGNGFVAGPGQNLNGCCPRGSAFRWWGRCCRATRGTRTRPRACARRTSG